MNQFYLFTSHKLLISYNVKAKEWFFFFFFFLTATKEWFSTYRYGNQAAPTNWLYRQNRIIMICLSNEGWPKWGTEQKEVRWCGDTHTVCVMGPLPTPFGVYCCCRRYGNKEKNILIIHRATFLNGTERNALVVCYYNTTLMWLMVKHRGYNVFGFYPTSPNTSK